MKAPRGSWLNLLAGSFCCLNWGWDLSHIHAPPTSYCAGPTGCQQSLRHVWLGPETRKVVACFTPSPCRPMMQRLLPAALHPLVKGRRQPAAGMETNWDRHCPRDLLPFLAAWVLPEQKRQPWKCWDPQPMPAALRVCTTCAEKKNALLVGFPCSGNISNICLPPDQSSTWVWGCQPLPCLALPCGCSLSLSVPPELHTVTSSELSPALNLSPNCNLYFLQTD